MSILGRKDMVLQHRNIGRNLLKTGVGSQPKQGGREIARRQRQEAKRLAKAAARRPP